MDHLRPLSGPADRIVAAVERWLAASVEPEPLVVETSGSSGAPKRVLLSRRAVVAAAEASAAHLGATGRWVLALPPTYVAGLMVIVRSLLAGERPVPLAGSGSFAETLSGAGGSGPWFASLVPTQLGRLLDEPEQAAALRGFEMLLIGGGPVDPSLRERARDAGVAMVATYGASETAGGVVYDGWPLDGVRLATDDDGRIRIAGPMLFDGYLGDPELTARTLMDGWFLTSDAGEVVDGRLRFLGRLDDVVVSGGVNVPLAPVAVRLREHPSVTAAELVGVPDPEWGHRVVAVVVPAPDAALALDELRDWVSGPLARAWAPRQLVVVDALPMLANGKVDRAALRGLA